MKITEQHNAILVHRLACDLLARAKIDQGVKSLNHLTVVVPTAQSGRRLRLELAKVAGGAVIPPEVVLPTQLLIDENDNRLATRAEEIAAFWTVDGGDFEKAVRLADLRQLLAEKALSFADVAAKAPEEVERWQTLAELEGRYYAELEQRGKLDRIVMLKAGIEQLNNSKREIIRLDDYEQLAKGVTLMPAANIIHGATPVDEARRIAEFFAQVKPSERLPALCVADPTMFTELKSAFEAKGMKLHDPSAVKLSTTSLGRLVRQVIAMQTSGSYSVFSAFIRGADVRRWLMKELQLDEVKLTAALVDLDNRQAEFLPEKIADIASKTTGTLRAIFEFVQKEIRKKGPRQLLRSIFTTYVLNDDESSREFAAAAEAVNELIDECFTMPEAIRLTLFERRLAEATFSQEPDEGEVIIADGWLELPFLDADEVVVAGFAEGCVPESMVGHPYLPDSLRKELGLANNESKTRRDRAIFTLLNGDRNSAAVRFYFHSVNADGDVLKPSRLLFEGCDDEMLLARARELYGVRAGTETMSVADLPEGWRLKLEIPPPYRELAKMSPTRLSDYLKCPFTFYLKDKNILGDKRMDDRAEELTSWEYGNLAHEALENFGLSDLKDSIDAEQIAAFLDEQVDRQLVDRFATAIPAIVAMQGESIKRRLRDFAEIQAERRQLGWRIVAVERKLETKIDHTLFHGKCDRIDFNDATGMWCVIDYKTYDTIDKTKCRDSKGKWISVQLPIYCMMLQANEGKDPLLAGIDRDHISSCYCVLGKNRREVAFTPPMNGAQAAEADETIKAAINAIEHGIFWPPSSKEEWKWDYEDWLSPDPKQTVDATWIADQEARKTIGSAR